jgi:two-component system, OmpR family, sensor kinase
VVVADVFGRGMTIRAKLMVTFAALIGITVGVAGLSLRSSAEARFLLERSRLAHAVLEEQLALHVDALRLFKRLVDPVLGDAADRAAGDAAAAALEARLARLRDAILAELTLLAATDERESEQDEFRAVRAIEEELRQITAAFGEVRQLMREGAVDRARAVLARVRAERVDGTLARLLDAAVAEEMREVAEADGDAQAALLRSDRAARLAAALAVLVGVGSALLVNRQVRRPLERLLEGTRALERGDLGHRIPVTGGDELGQIAAGFNRTAEEMERSRRELLASRDELERAVAARTEELQRANAALTRADLVRRRFFADISHELRTPLTVIRGESEIALRGPDKSSADYKLALERVAEQSGQLGRLVDDLLFVARADAGAARLARQTVNLGSLLRAVCRDGLVLGREAEVRVELREHTADSSLVGDPGRLRQMFLILVDNAVRYSKPGGTVTVDLSPAPRGLSVRVADEGAGIAAGELETVFERFQRGANASAFGEEGSGLGLPVAKAIAEAHGGEITLASELDRGTVATVFLPATARLRAVAS